MDEDDKENQADELLALASIFEDEDTFAALEDQSGGSFYAAVELPDDCCVKLSGTMVQQARALGATLRENGENSWLLPVVSLPPIELNFQYPRDYPSKSAPDFTLSSKWLSVNQLTRLCEKLDEIWESNANEVVIYQWTEFLKTETLSHLGITSPIDLDVSDLPRTLRQRSMMEGQGYQAGPRAGPGGDGGEALEGATGGVGLMQQPAGVAMRLGVRAMQDTAALTHLTPTIVAHDKLTQDRIFDASFNTCGVCYEDKFGRDCLRFSGCGHVYCKACMAEHFRVKILDGDVKGLLCPENDCTSQALAPQVKELVDHEVFEKYDARLLDLSLSEMGDIVFCPRKACQCPVIRDEKTNMGLCPQCRFAFCILCKNTFHGVAPCKISQEEYRKLKDEYENASSEERSILEQKFGKRTLRQVIDDCNSEEWIRKHSKNCPQCSRAIQKYDGCNKMTCTKCRCYFCWLCSAVLPRSDPYSHFRGQCGNRLFEGIVDTDDEQEDLDPNELVNVVGIDNWWNFI
ncbi:E3 ubiquitin-protein ligase RNF14-like [Diadema antillarum]|uniref:E3 ubiquitin-protein ligase RNF14-like n=1 Tax=Diadema antillarum TaxID=105358 RepID=UPI003A887EBC